MKRLPKIFSVISGLLLVFNNVALLSHTVNAVSSTYTVDRLTDNNVAGGGEGSGVTGDLRYAVTHAKSGENISFKVTGTIYLKDALPILTRNITIEGRGANQLVVDGAGGSVLSVSNGTSIIISGLAITGGSGNGGGIFNAGTLTLNHCTISGNRAGDPTNGGGTGAGIWNYTSGNLTLNNSTVSGNSVYGNSSYNPSRGGGIANYGTLTINNSTISGNSASEGTGGGISNTLATSILTLRNTTIGGNSVSGTVGKGGGIHNLGTLNAVNTIIGGNTGSQNPDLSGTINSSGHNLIGNTSGGSGFRTDLGDILNVSPMLSTLQNNGGPTKTMALLSGSPALNAGSDTVCNAAPINKLDQRGVTRPQGSHCDIGAYEYEGTSIIQGIKVKIGDVIEGIYPLAPSQSLRQSYAMVNNGPVRIEHTDNKIILASQRVIYDGKSYSEMMGFPLEQLSHEYWFPYYNNVATNSQLRVSNVGSELTAINVYLGTQQIDSYSLAAGAAIRKNYLGKNGGPLRVTSSVSNILGSIRVLYGNSSYSEMMGFPLEQLSHEYWFPYYNNVAMNSQLRVSNVGSQSTTINVYLGTQQIDSYSLAAGAATRKNYLGKNGGPLRVTSSTTNILSTVRVLFNGNSYSELMGFPVAQLTDQYWYPIYDNSLLDSQLRVSNVGTNPTTVTIYMGTTQIDSYNLSPGTATRKNYPQNTGPLHVVSNPEPILTTIRMLYKTSGYLSFYEIMGLPNMQLSTKYFFSWYNNVAIGSELRLARP